MTLSQSVNFNMAALQPAAIPLLKPIAAFGTRRTRKICNQWQCRVALGKPALLLICIMRIAGKKVA
jgi:hypothetical protein